MNPETTWIRGRKDADLKKYLARKAKMSPNSAALPRKGMDSVPLAVRLIAVSISMVWLLFTLIGAIAPPVLAQLAPTGEHYPGRPSDTGYGGTLVNATGTFATAIPLDLPPARGGLPIPLQIAYGARGVGAAGLGWDVPLSYIQRDSTFAYRRPASSSGALPAPRERAYLSLFGQGVELVRDGSAWVARSGTLELMVRESFGSWLAYDGMGRTYTFRRPAELGSTGFWLLKSIDVAGGASVQITYQVATWPLSGGVGIAIDLVRIDYNNAPVRRGCAKNEVALTYGNSSPTPLSMSVLGDKILVRKKTLTLVDVNSRATCGTPYQRLRRYDFQYVPDTDTQLPRLRTVRMFGRQGTPEENTALPIASYGYGSATQDNALRYQTTQTIALPAGVANTQISGTSLDPTVNAPVTGDRYAMWQTLTDVTGDGRPDLVFKKNNKLWVAYNRPGPNGSTTLGVGGQAIAQLSDTTFKEGGFSTHTSVKQRFDYAVVNRNTINVWRQAIDINGDGRIDIVDAAEEPDHWVVYLNTPGGPTGVKWERRSFSVTNLRAALVSSGHVIDSPHVPLSRRATGTNVETWECWKWDGTKWNWYSQGFSNHRCEGVDGQILHRGPERTYVEWELIDLNGDGYPDFVFNSSPVDFQLEPPPSHNPTPVTGAVFSRSTWHPFAPRSTNEVRASFNVRGVRFDTNADPFSRSVQLAAALPEHGVTEWLCPGTDPRGNDPCDDSTQIQYVGFADVNGDGLVDRVVFNRAYLGAYAGTAVEFSNVYITLPGPLAEVHNTHKEQCEGPGHKPTSDQTQGLRDLTGDGIPDYYDKDRVWIGTGTGFRQAINIETTGAADFRFSHQTESCNGDTSNTDGGLYDIDGDGKPEVIGLGGNTVFVSQLAGGQAPGRPEAGRLTEIDNGYGAKTSITYVSAKNFTDNPVPFSEIVVSSVATTGTQNLGGTLVGSRYAYGNAELVFDSALDRFSFPGYKRSVELRLFGTSEARPAPSVGDAIITDTWPLTPFFSSLTKQERWLRMQRVGRVRDIFRLRGIVTPDAWSLLNVLANDTRIIGVTHYEYDAKLYEAPLSPTENIFDCLEMFLPLDYSLSIANNFGNKGVDACRAHGFGYGLSRDAWFGWASPPSDNNVQTRSQTLAMDDFGRPIITEYDNDVFRSDDDICVENTFATPTRAFPRVLNALASRRFYDCKARGITFASERWAYEGLPTGLVSNGWMTSHSVDRRATDTGALLKTVHRFDATYNTAGNRTTVRTRRDGSTRTVTYEYDSFGLVPTHTKLDATGIPSIDLVTGYDLVSLQPVSATDPNQTRHGIDFDGFGRPIRATVTPPVGPVGVLSTMNYLGFASTEPDGRRITAKRFSDPVAPTNVSTAAGQSGTVFLDELGRERRMELALGSDYVNEVLVVDSRTYDDAGRVVFAADRYAKSQNPATAYGTSYHYTNTGDLNCMIRGQGFQVLSMVTDVATERFPTCFQRSFASHTNTLDVRDAASLQAGSPLAGVVKRIAATAIGRVIERSTLMAGVRLEDATFSHDRLGQRTSMTRFLDPAGATLGVQSWWRLDSLGQTLEVSEPDTATRSYSYSDWGEPVETRWLDGGIDRRLRRRYDALGRLTAIEERKDGITDSETVNTYAYDAAVNVSPLVTPTFVLGQLARATSPSGQVTFSYDVFGRVNAQVFTNNQGGLYIEKAEHHADGRLSSLEFNLPDRKFARELVKYAYDSAGRLRNIEYADPSGARQLYSADVIDIYGRVLKALYGGNTTFHAVYANDGRRLIKEEGVESPLGSRRLIFEQFDPLDREVSRREIKDGTAITTESTYDPLGRLRDVMKVEGGTALPEWAYGYDSLGNVQFLRHFPNSTPDAWLSYHQVGDRDRVCRIGYGAGLGGTACNVAYDGVGNTVEQVTRTGVRRLEYFASGNVRRITEGATEARFRYDAFGSVQELDLTGTGVSDTRHDRRYGGLIERRDQVVNGTTTTFISRNIPGPGGIVASRRGAGDEWVFQFGEARGNRFFTYKDGEFLQDVDYEPYGEAKSFGKPPGSPYYTSSQWNGQDALAAFGLSHLGARLYDPVIGRFLSRDPLLAPRTANTSNPYAFAANDPWNAADPSGLDCIGKECNPAVSIIFSAEQVISGVGWVISTEGKAISALGSFFGAGNSSPAPQGPPVSAGPSLLNSPQATQHSPELAKISDLPESTIGEGIELGGDITSSLELASHGFRIPARLLHGANLLFNGIEFARNPSRENGLKVLLTTSEILAISSVPESAPVFLTIHAIHSEKLRGMARDSARGTAEVLLFAPAVLNYWLGPHPYLDDIGGPPDLESATPGTRDYYEREERIWQYEERQRRSFGEVPPAPRMIQRVCVFNTELQYWVPTGAVEEVGCPPRS